MISIVVFVAGLQLIAADLFYLGLKNYTQIKKENYPLVVLYYGEDRNSRKFQSDFLLIAQGEHEINNRSVLPAELNFGLVNSKAESKLMEKTQISDVPTAYLFLDDDTKQKYTGAWNALSFVNWVKKTFRDNPESNQYHPSSVVYKFEQLQKKFQMFYLVAILITPDYRLAPLKAFVNATKTLPAGYVFCHVHDTKLAGILGIDKEESALLVYSKHEDIPDATDEERKKWLTYTHKFKGDIRSSDEINGFLQLYSWRGWFYVDDTKFQKLSRRKDRYPTIMLLYNASLADHSPYVEDFKRARLSLVRKAALGLLDINNDARERLERIFDINVTTDSPKLIAIKPITDDKFEKFIDDTLDPVEFYEKLYSTHSIPSSTGVLVPFWKNQQLTELYDKVGVRKLTRDTYYPWIAENNEAGRDVVVTYTAKGCQVCKDFLPEYHSVIKNVTRHLLQDKVTFARVDVGLNELDNVVIENYPQVRLYKAGADGPLIQRTDFTEEKLYKWISEVSNYGHLLSSNDDL